MPRSAGERWADVTCKSDDGLDLYSRDYAPMGSDPSAYPVLCLPGLTRNTRDFHELALRLTDRWRVISCDFRGRGRSGYDADPSNYNPLVETADTLKLVERLDLPQVHVVGTSRGGIVSMFMAMARPDLFLSACLNDVGPRLEPTGLVRIAGYVTGTAIPKSWDAAARSLKSVHGEAFPGLSDEQWIRFARCVYRDEDGRPIEDYDPGLKTVFSSNPDAARGIVPELWEQFDALAHIPVLVVRGANSDLLSNDTVQEMVARHPACSAVTIADRGHAPFLDEPDAVAAIRHHLEMAENTNQTSRPQS